MNCNVFDMASPLTQTTDVSQKLQTLLVLSATPEDLSSDGAHWNSVELRMNAFWDLSRLLVNPKTYDLVATPEIVKVATEGWNDSQNVSVQSESLKEAFQGQCLNVFRWLFRKEKGVQLLTNNIYSLVMDVLSDPARGDLRNSAGDVISGIANTVVGATFLRDRGFLEEFENIMRSDWCLETSYTCTGLSQTPFVAQLISDGARKFLCQQASTLNSGPDEILLNIENSDLMRSLIEAGADEENLRIKGALRHNAALDEDDATQVASNLYKAVQIEAEILDRPIAEIIAQHMGPESELRTILMGHDQQQTRINLMEYLARKAATPLFINVSPSRPGSVDGLPKLRAAIT